MAMPKTTVEPFAGSLLSKKLQKQESAPSSSFKKPRSDDLNLSNGHSQAIGSNGANKPAEEDNPRPLGEGVKDDMMDLQKRVRTLKENLGKTKGEVSHDLNVLRSQSQKQGEEIGLLKSKEKELEGANMTLKSENENLKSKCNTLATRNADLESKVQTLEGRTKKGGDLYELLEEIKKLVGGVGEDVDAMIIEHKREA